MNRGDVIKLGRVILKVRKYHLKNCLTKDDNSILETSVVSKCHSTIGELCRICHSEEDCVENPLLSICHCTGSMRFVHYKCLRTWLTYKLHIKKQGHLISYHWRSFECEICKTLYPSSIEYEGVEYTLADIVLPLTENYLVLETLSKSKAFSKVIHILISDESKSVFRIGRGHEADLKIADMSVSRAHATITMTENGFALEDDRSKFGTLILLKEEPHEIDADNDLTVQIGRTMVTFSLRQKDLLNFKGVAMQDSELTKALKREMGNTYDS